MKCSEFLWKYIDLQSKLKPITSMEVCGLLGKTMAENGDTTIVSDVTGEPMSQDDALSVLGFYARRDGEGKLMEAYHAGQKSLFEKLVADKNMSTAEYLANKKKAEEETASSGEGQ